MKILGSISSRYQTSLREKAIKRAQTRIILAGKVPEDFSSDDLEVIVQEEEEKIRSAIKEKGLLAVLALLGISWFG